MTAREMMTSLGALALGLAIAGAVPALAQNTTTPGATTTPGTTAPATPAPPAGAAPQAAPATPGHMTHPQMATRHRIFHRKLGMHLPPSSANPNAQNAQVEQLNQQSLEAAHQGRTFTPGGSM
jgi:hypothetical protein